ncbi:MAG: hemerythrin domain-containing protein [Elusimicrobia bacterium]|nr:hemerythrin domain-containing protein [Elusimicrobiota bacterium]MDE2236463.1 hemerythrin domain-containing protein [Elusimicrobiota bacterium]MDE2424842.1 hemerythrin domain-containing protein [Elusimicrobiota bacterium]
MTETTNDEITAFFKRDHRRIDLELGRFHHEVQSERALPSLDAFEGMLLRHIDWEERVLFPAFEEKLGKEAVASVVSMRIQHGELKQRIAELRQSLKHGGMERRNIEEVLTEALSDHNHAEEGFIYPWMDGAFTREERRALLRGLEKIR